MPDQNDDQLLPGDGDGGQPETSSASPEVVQGGDGLRAETPALPSRLSEETDSSQDIVFVLGSSRRTNLRRVEQELGDLWLTTGEEARLRGRGGVARVRELNLLVFARGEEMAQRVSDLVTRVAQCHPGRVLVLLDQGPEGGGASGDFEAWVTAACYLTHEGGKQICWEQITLPASSRSVPKLFAAAVPLLVPDLPVTLWWPGHPDLEGRLFNQLGEIADRVILDSAGYRDAAEGLRDIRRLMDDPERDYALGDLNWARVTPWREMIAEPFDDPLRRQLLTRINRLEIAYSDEEVYDLASGATRPAACRALLLAGWLASRLEWQTGRGRWEKLDGAFRTELMVPGGSPAGVELVLRPGGSAECTKGGIGEILINFDSAGRENSCMSVSRSADTCVCSARFRQGNQEALVKTIEMSDRPDDDLLCEELDFGGPDPVYQDALQMAYELAHVPGATALWE
jgi:glucose-6-phosphate dehydrogenase assembly protein OpcA